MVKDTEGLCTQCGKLGILGDGLCVKCWDRVPCILKEYQTPPEHKLIEASQPESIPKVKRGRGKRNTGAWLRCIDCGKWMYIPKHRLAHLNWGKRCGPCDRKIYRGNGRPKKRSP